MIIDGHAHACGEYFDLESIINVLDENQTDKVVLCPGEANSRKTCGLPLLADRFPQKDMMFAVNRVIGFVTKLRGTAKHIDAQNRYVYQLSQKAADRIIQAYWINPLDRHCITKLKDDHEEYGFKLIKVHQCWHKFDISSGNFEKIIQWAEDQNKPIFIYISTISQVDTFVQIANKYMNNIFILAHLIILSPYNCVN